MALPKQTGELIKKFMLRGLVFSVPLLFTLWVLNLVSGVADTVVGPLTRVLLRIVASIVPEALHVGPLASGEWPFLSLLLLLFLLTVLGGFISWRYGARIANWVDGKLMKSPGVGFLYRNARKMSEFFDLAKGSPFQRVVLIPYPSPHVLTVAFVSGQITVEWEGGTEKVYLKVVVPNPPTGIQGIGWIEERFCKDIPGMTVEDGLQYYVSLGVVAPERIHVKGSPFDADAVIQPHAPNTPPSA